MSTVSEVLEQAQRKLAFIRAQEERFQNERMNEITKVTEELDRKLDLVTSSWKKLTECIGAIGRIILSNVLIIAQICQPIYFKIYWSNI